MSLNYIISYLNRDLLYSKAVFRKIEEKNPCLSILHNLKEKKPPFTKEIKYSMKLNSTFHNNMLTYSKNIWVFFINESFPISKTKCQINIIIILIIIAENNGHNCC